MCVLIGEHYSYIVLMMVFVNPVKFRIVHYLVHEVEDNFLNGEEEGELPKNGLNLGNAVHIHFDVEGEEGVDQGQKRAIEQNI